MQDLHFHVVGSKTDMTANDQEVPLKDCTNGIITGTLTGFVGSLSGVGSMEDINIEVKK